MVAQLKRKQQPKQADGGSGSNKREREEGGSAGAGMQPQQHPLAPSEGSVAKRKKKQK